MQLNTLSHAPALVSLTGNNSFSIPHIDRMRRQFGADIAWRAASFEMGMAAAAASSSGAFSVGLSDGMGRTALAVDRFAIHSLCYRVAQGELQFAPRADTLAGGRAELDPQAIFDYLFFHTIPSPRTIFKGVYRLPPAHCAIYENGQLSVQPYWEPRFTEPPKACFADLRAEFLALLGQAVADQLDGSKPACFLSGGTDSSTVAGLISRYSAQPASTYSIGFDAPGYDEMEYARLAARSFGTVHHEHYLTPDDLVRSIASVATHYDQPFGNSSVLPTYYCAAMARADGVQHLLAGDGGDELFGGNARYAHQRVLGWYGALPAMLRSHLMEPALGHAAARRLPLVRKAASYVEQARVALPERLNLYNLLNRLGMQKVFMPDFLQQVDPLAAPAQQWQIWQQACTDNTLQRNLAYDWRYTLAENDLPKVCGSSALAGLSVGFPLLDQRLLDFSLRLPAAYKLKGLRLRWFFKQALRGFLPEAILAKKKHGFGLPFGFWLCRHAGLRQLASDSLQSFGERGIVQPGFLHSLLNQQLQQHPGYYGEMVWLLMVLERWLRVHAPNYRAGR
jgi:asparagine synthase (glutamine-hydrolysing)